MYFMLKITTPFHLLSVVTCNVMIGKLYEGDWLLQPSEMGR